MHKKMKINTYYNLPIENRTKYFTTMSLNNNNNKEAHKEML